MGPGPRGRAGREAVYGLVPRLGNLLLGTRHVSGMRWICLLWALAGCGTPGAAAGDASGTSSGTSSDSSGLATDPNETEDAGPNDPFTVASPDGAVWLEIPAGALPPGVSPQDVQIVPADGSDMELEGLSYRAGYDFVPDGLEFSTPATMHYRFVPGEETSLFLHLSEDDLEGFDLQIVDADPNTDPDEVEVGAPLAHFSRFFHATIPSTAGGTKGIVQIEQTLHPAPAPIGGHIYGAFRAVTDQGAITSVRIQDAYFTLAVDETAP